VNIVTVSRDRLESLVPLFDAYRVFYQRESNLEAARDYLQTRLERHEATAFLALEKGTPLGFALCYCTFSSVTLKTLVILNDLHTIPEARGQGVATMLIKTCANFARDHGAETLRLRTARDNVWARHVYEQAGFVQDERFYTYDLKL
jgi:GNAT superfamily N-acetyltransferase